MLSVIIESFSKCKQHLKGGAKIYIHGSASIHRTVMTTYAMLKYIGYSHEESKELLERIRPLIGEGVGKDRIKWADTHFEYSSNKSILSDNFLSFEKNQATTKLCQMRR